MKLLHYALQRSGSNYLETLLKKRYQVSFLNSNSDRRSPLQKHFRLYSEKHIIPEPQYHNNYIIPDLDTFESLLGFSPEHYLIISKDPYSWLLSYKSWAQKCNWPTPKHHYIQEYNLFYEKWLEFTKQTNKLTFVRYIDLLEDVENELLRLESLMNLRKRYITKFISNPVGKVSQSSKFSNQKREYYLREKYLHHYTQKELHDINDLLDENVISGLGYVKLHQKKGATQK